MLVTPDNHQGTTVIKSVLRTYLSVSCWNLNSIVSAFSKCAT